LFFYYYYYCSRNALEGPKRILSQVEGIDGASPVNIAGPHQLIIPGAGLILLRDDDVLICRG